MLKHLISSAIFSNYIVSAFRSLVRRKMNLVLPVIALSNGLAAALMLTLSTINESSYDSLPLLMAKDGSVFNKPER
jgi:hypothetical protein